MQNDDNRAGIAGFFVGDPDVVPTTPHEQIISGVEAGDTPTIANQKIWAQRVRVAETEGSPGQSFGPAIDVTDGLDRLLDYAMAAIKMAFKFFPFIVPILILSHFGGRYLPFGLNLWLANRLQWISVPWFIYQGVKVIRRLPKRSDKTNGKPANFGVVARPIYERNQLPNGKITITFRQRIVNFVATDILLVLPFVVLTLVGIFTGLMIAVTYNFILGFLWMFALTFGPLLVVHRLNWRKKTIVVTPGREINCGGRLLSCGDVYEFGWKITERKGKGGFFSITDSVAYAILNGGEKVLLTKEMRGNSAASICAVLQDLAFSE
jgi:hypothetical protein